MYSAYSTQYFTEESVINVPAATATVTASAGSSARDVDPEPEVFSNARLTVQSRQPAQANQKCSPSLRTTKRLRLSSLQSPRVLSLPRSRQVCYRSYHRHPAHPCPWRQLLVQLPLPSHVRRITMQSLFSSLALKYTNTSSSAIQTSPTPTSTGSSRTTAIRGVGQLARPPTCELEALSAKDSLFTMHLATRDTTAS